MALPNNNRNEKMNQRHRGVEKLTAISPRAKTGSRGGWIATATKNGGRRSLQKFDKVKLCIEGTNS